MKTNIPALLVFGTTLLGSVAVAQTVAPAAPASAPAASALVPSQTIFLSRLPSPVELTNAASAQGLTIERIEQSNAVVTVVYKYSDGQTKTVAYQMLPVAGTTSPAPVVVAAPTTIVPSTVYYESAPRVYYDDYYYPYARGWYPPVSLNLGLGFYRGGYGFRGGGGFHHWGHR